MGDNNDPPRNNHDSAGNKPSGATILSSERANPKAADHKTRTQRDKKHPLEWAIFGFVVISALATSFAAVFTCKQWFTAADQEKRSLRAYVNLKETPSLSKTMVSVSDPTKRPIFGIWQNSGNTATAKFTSKVGCSAERPFVYDQENTWKQTDKWVLGPHQEFEVSVCPIGIQTLSDIIAARRPLYIYGEAEYGDVFSPEKARHVTRWCLVEQDITGDVKGGILNTTSVPCSDKQNGRHSNCTDEECDTP